VTRELSDRIDAANAEIETRGLQTVAGDRTGLSLVLQNLVSNAIKFQEPDEPAHVGIELEREGANWHLVVEDDGIGFDPKYSDRIFRMFERLEGPGERPGTGIGLAICRKVVEAHGGRIWAESEPGEGTAVHVRLPVEPDLPEEDEEELGPPPGLRPGQGPV
jgi:signal transduction histidine kinase